MKHTHYTLLFILLIISDSSAAKNKNYVSNLKIDESLVFFNTNAWLNEQTNQWHTPIHGWVFEAEGSTIRKALIVKSFKTLYQLETSA